MVRDVVVGGDSRGVLEAHRSGARELHPLVCERDSPRRPLT
jgi:hypothetical protein